MQCIKWGDQLAGEPDDNAALDVIRYYIRFDAWPDILDAPDPPPLDVVRRQVDRGFVEKLGPEDESKVCKQSDCSRGTVAFSIYCKKHHFENVRKRSYPFED